MCGAATRTRSRADEQGRHLRHRRLRADRPRLSGQGQSARRGRRSPSTPSIIEADELTGPAGRAVRPARAIAIRPASTRCWSRSLTAGQPGARAEIFERCKDRGYGCITYVARRRSAGDVKFGENSFVFDENTLQPNVRSAITPCSGAATTSGTTPRSESTASSPPTWSISGNCTGGRVLLHRGQRDLSRRADVAPRMRDRSRCDDAQGHRSAPRFTRATAPSRSRRRAGS